MLTLQRYCVVCMHPRYHKNVKGIALKYAVMATWLLSFTHLIFLFHFCNYQFLTSWSTCEDPKYAWIVYVVMVIDKLLAVISIVEYYLIYRRISSLSSMVSSIQYRPEKRVMQQALPFTVAKIMLLLLILPPWLLNSTFREECPLFYVFSAFDYFLIPTVIPLSFLSTFYRQYKTNLKPAPHQPKTNRLGN
ncbi:unnamed protein product [Caenorhabditis auriculariae]|uniref:G-protein coupled receptors family 1 profile domain-containing protein n=1 Tax=Caenorhabditis auriculariae TaxID=2777116 RepID=A0A8S1H681_9PELO|nr:unnamed protein product [Caenorhabditis auriculariae]